MISSSRRWARETVERPAFQQAVIGLIVFNAVTLGLETSTTVMGAAGGLLLAIDRVVLAVFVVEIGLRLYAHGWRFWRDPWNVFDFVIVGISLVPASGPLSVLRALRVLRVLRLISVVPSMRRVVAGLLSAVPGMASISALLVLILYVSGVMATKLFATTAPDYFGDLGTTLFTLFQTMTGEAWPDIAREVMAEQPYAWIFFVVFILVSSFMVLNLFIAVVVSAMEGQVAEEVAEQHQEEQIANAQILAEIRELRTELAALRAGSPG
ncbi:MAG: ion transporter [Pseudonocardia sp.]